ncbi:hypothetical protein [Streptomyces carpaticus]|uniref:hypothetical protein n=1 Tax=Streptomyces carpaticus TaxID=285558 RepID=UPI0031F834B5
MGRRKLKPWRPGSVSVRTVSTPAELDDALAAVFPRPASGGWREDVLGAASLSLRVGEDGWPLLNGHRVTQEMCAALQRERPEEAADFEYEHLVAMAEVMGPPDVSGLDTILAATAECCGRQLDHQDGSMSCTRGTRCPSVALRHAGWMDCHQHGPCAHCEGPPVVWECDRR